MYNYFNPYNSNPYPTAQPSYPSQRQEIVKVNGRPGAEAYQMPANSSVLLLDETAPVVWLAQTDGAGYKTVMPYDIKPHQAEKPVDVKSLLQRVEKLEAMINVNESKSDPAGDADKADDAR